MDFRLTSDQESLVSAIDKIARCIFTSDPPQADAE